MSPPSHSLIWKYFEPNGQDNALCIICKKKYSRKGRTTTSLKNHLKSMHSEQYSAFKNLESEQQKNKENSGKRALN